MRLLLLLLAGLAQQEIPYKASDEFEVTLDYQFKTFKENDPQTVDFIVKRPAPGPQLYLVAFVKLKKINTNEARVRISNNLTTSSVNKKAEQDMTLKIDFGFIENVKDQTAAHEYSIILISSDRKEISKIDLFIDKDGTFLVNGQKRGKF